MEEIIPDLFAVSLSYYCFIPLIFFLKREAIYPADFMAWQAQYLTQVNCYRSEFPHLNTILWKCLYSYTIASTFDLSNG